MMDSPESPEAPQPREMIDLEATFEKLEHELQVRNPDPSFLSAKSITLVLLTSFSSAGSEPKRRAIEEELS